LTLGLLLLRLSPAAVGGIVPIVVSWFLSPLLAALITLVLFTIIRTAVLRRANSTKIAFWVLPVLILLTFFINLFFILVSRNPPSCVLANMSAVVLVCGCSNLFCILVMRTACVAACKRRLLVRTSAVVAEAERGW
jgi:phosphate/sulfate permease